MVDMVALCPPGKLGMKVIYVKDVGEVSRNKSELRCRITVVTNVSTMKGFFRFFEQDGRSMAAWNAK